MKIEYKYANGEPHTFIALDFILENEESIFLIGYDKGIESYCVMGLLEDDEGEYYFYRILLGDDANAEDEVNQLMDFIEGEEYEIYNYGFTYKKNKIPSKFGYFLQEKPLFMVSHMVPYKNLYMRPSLTFGLYNKVELLKPTY